MKEEEGHVQLKKFVESLVGDSKSLVEKAIKLLVLDCNIYVGIDPGVTGAIAFLHPTDLKKSIAIDIPNVQIVTGRKTASGAPSHRTQTDLGALWDLFVICKPLWGSTFVVIEQQQPMPKDTALTGFTVGKNFGMWPLFLYSHGIAHDTIRPVAWKRAQKLMKQGKEAARMRAQKLFPRASLKRKKDHNRAEALLIAYTYQEKWEKEAKEKVAEAFGVPVARLRQ